MIIGQVYSLIRDGADKDLTCPISDCDTEFLDIRRLKAHCTKAHGITELTCRTLDGGVAKPPPSTAGFEPLSPPSLDALESLQSSTPGLVPPPPLSQKAGPSRTRHASVRLQPYTKPSPLSGTLEPVLHPVEDPVQSPILVDLPEVSPHIPVAHLDGLKSYMLSPPLLVRLSLRYHQHYQTLHCVVCLSVLTVQTASRHLGKHNIQISKSDLSELEDFELEHPVVALKALIPPPSGGPPVEGLAVITTGHGCTACSDSFQCYKSFRNHWGSVHVSESTGPKESFYPCVVQTFQLQATQFFQVNPLLSKLPSTDPFYIFLTKNVPEFKNSEVIAQAVSAKDTPPLLQVTGWHEHLQDYITDKRTLAKLKDLSSLPGVKDTSALGQLRPLVRAYLKDIRTKNKNSSLSVRCALMQYPR